MTLTTSALPKKKKIQQFNKLMLIKSKTILNVILPSDHDASNNPIHPL
jgi:hypothetical protein